MLRKKIQYEIKAQAQRIRERVGGGESEKKLALQPNL